MSPYFHNLNYTLANEDTTVEIALLPKSCNTVISVNGSGARCLPLLLKKPKRLICVDLSIEQLLFTQLKVETFKQLSYSEYLKFWGFPPEDGVPSNERKEIFEKLKLPQNVFEYMKNIFKYINWNSPLYFGRWERTFQKLSKINQKMTGSSGQFIFNFKDLKEQKEYWNKGFPQFRWKLVVFFLSSATLFNALLYKGYFPKPNVSSNMFQFYLSCFEKKFNEGLARENFFLQLCFFGRIVYPEALPVDSKIENFEKIKNALYETEIEFIQGDLIDVIVNQKRKIDFVSLSDVPSYFSGEIEKKFMQLILPHLSPKARVVLRSYRHRPENMNLNGFVDISKEHIELFKSEKVGVYLIEVFERDNV